MKPLADSEISVIVLIMIRIMSSCSWSYGPRPRAASSPKLLRAIIINAMLLFKTIFKCTSVDCLPLPQPVTAKAVQPASRDE